MKVCISVPCYSGQVSLHFLNSMLQTYPLLQKQNIGIEFRVAPGVCFIDMARNILIAEFLKGDATDLLFIDDDIGFDPQAVVEILTHDEEIIGGCYPYKRDQESYPVSPVSGLDGNFVVNENGLIEVNTIAAGFLRIKRSVLERYVKAHPELKCSTRDEAGNVLNEFYNIFQCKQVGTAWYGEDIYFVNAMRFFGVKVWALPNLNFTHSGKKNYKGNYQEYILKGQHVNS